MRHRLGVIGYPTDIVRWASIERPRYNPAGWELADEAYQCRLAPAHRGRRRPLHRGRPVGAGSSPDTLDLGNHPSSRADVPSKAATPRPTCSSHSSVGCADSSYASCQVCQTYAGVWG